MGVIGASQHTDRQDNIILNATHMKKIAGSATTVVEAAGTDLVVLGVVIWADVDSGTLHFTDGDGVAITGLPDATNKAMTDYPGTFPLFRTQLTNGLKVVTASATGLVATVFYAK